MENKFCPSFLPAKKRNPVDVSYCLPAKKRIRALQPLDLNLQPLEAQEINKDEQKPEPVHPEAKEINEEEELRPEATTESGDEDDDDDGILCAVCNDTNAEPTNQIVLCDGCDVAVHQSCYGNPLSERLPAEDEQWFCNKCIESKAEVISCCLCPVPGGALKRTKDGQWAHLVCAIWVPEVFFEDWEGREGIDCRQVLKSRWGKKCCVCGSKSGCSVDCSEAKCPMAFHVTCGWKQGLSFTYKAGGLKTDVVAAFCKPHSHLWKKQEHTGKYKIVAREETEK